MGLGRNNFNITTEKNIRKSFVKLTSTPPYQTTTHTYATTPRKISKKKKIPPLHHSLHRRKKSQNFPPKSHSCYPQKNQISLAVTPQKTFLEKHQNAHYI